MEAYIPLALMPELTSLQTIQYLRSQLTGTPTGSLSQVLSSLPFSSSPLLLSSPPIPSLLSLLLPLLFFFSKTHLQSTYSY
jgi:hypothetical protein